MEREQIMDLIKEKLCIVMDKPSDKVEWDESAPLADYYELDSFMMIELLLGLEPESSFDITTVLPEHLTSIANLAAFIYEAQTSGQLS